MKRTGVDASDGGNAAVWEGWINFERSVGEPSAALGEVAKVVERCCDGRDAAERERVAGWFWYRASMVVSVAPTMSRAAGWARAPVVSGGRLELLLSLSFPIRVQDAGG